ncbi:MULTISPECIES: DUF5691 domain-containing protein [unclassified Leptolyngbya]|uniref:DUF5691 domain-containing protein n=1 Tax=unclassified Leptolyngbya TaxID=2650499 RepID=UPI0016878A7A|nr:MULTISPECIES: DUF5691 domain-containing protein [unclassified Leptolyngbya]MBD1909046.1 hypothetical protein [Leptolyngbya sp. FACHB-8]MBD2157427.1 hypothetical protein [Leptolyngbya sp. FACHB-16]
MASATDSTDSLWQAIGSAALLGTGRQSFQIPNASGNLVQCLSQLSDRPPEVALLCAAGMVALHQRVGWLPVTQAIAEVESCASTDLPRCSPHAARCLQRILEGQFPQQLPQLLGEWLTKAQINGLRVPEMLLPALMDKGRSQRVLRPAISAVLGQRGQWLAAQNPDWSYAIALVGEADWETGTPEARLALLQNLRANHPAHARDLLQATWSQEAAGDRTQFLETFRVGLSLADEPFLEVALGDRRSKEVRRVAADLLASLPDSRLSQEMANLLQPYIFFSPSPASINVQLPDALTPELMQLGIEAKPSRLSSLKLGEKAGWLLQMIAATPLSFWNRWGMTAEELVALAQQSEWQTVFFQGWAIAAQRQGDRPWMIALLHGGIVTAQSEQNPVLNHALEQSQAATLFRLLSPDQQNAFLLSWMRSGIDVITQSFTISLLSQSSDQWSVELTQTVLTSLERYFANTSDLRSIAWELRTNLHQFAHFIPVQFLPDVMQLQNQIPANSPWHHSVEALLSLMQFRREMIRAFERNEK